MKALLPALVALNLIAGLPQPLRKGWAYEISSRDTTDPKLIFVLSGLPGYSLSDANDPQFMRRYAAKYLDHPVPRLFVRVYRDEIKVRTLDEKGSITIKRKDLVGIRWQKEGKT